MRMSRDRVVWLALVLIGKAAPPAHAATAMRARFEAGLGSIDVRPLPYESTVGGTVAAGVGLPLMGAATAWLEYAATAGSGGGSFISDIGDAGRRSLVTARIGIEVHGPSWRRGPFASLGVGVGRCTLSGARRDLGYGIPSRDLTAFALGASAGYRFGWVPEPFALQIGVHAHALLDSGDTPASAQALTFGLVY